MCKGWWGAGGGVLMGSSWVSVQVRFRLPWGQPVPPWTALTILKDAGNVGGTRGADSGRGVAWVRGRERAVAARARVSFIVAVVVVVMAGGFGQ